MNNSRLQLMTVATLESENTRFAGTAGVSQNNRSCGFIPAFCDMETHTVEPSRFTGGALAPVHLLDGLPPAWIESRNTAGHVTAVKGTVVAGFLLDGHFYTREQAAAMTRH
jgi:hypothetical protein